MPINVEALVAPSETAVLVIECQEGVIGEGASIPGLRRSVLDSGMLPRLSRLLDRARTAGVQVVHCTVERAPTSRVRSGMRRFGKEASEVVASAEGGSPGRIVKELAPHPADLVSQRAYGMSAFYQSGLDDELRTMGIKTVVVTGVSLNIAITGVVIEAVNRGYRAVLPTDCAASDPPEYAEWIIRCTLRNMAVLTTASALEAAWASS